MFFNNVHAIGYQHESRTLSHTFKLMGLRQLVFSIVLWLQIVFNEFFA